MFDIPFYLYADSDKRIINDLARILNFFSTLEHPYVFNLMMLPCLFYICRSQ
jgi:hypothetical protein